MGVEIKGNKEGFAVIIDQEHSFLETREKLLQKFEESKEFFKGTKFTKFVAPSLNKADAKYLKSLLEEVYDVKFEESETENNEKTGFSQETDKGSKLKEAENTIERFKEKLTSFDETIDKIKEITAKSEALKQVETKDNNLKTKFLFENLRSGSEVSYEGNIVVFGDVNPGAKITAHGNIIILGSFRGMAHAGKGNEGDCFLAALRLLPLQIRIKDMFAVPPQDAKIIENALVKIKSNEIVIEHF